MNGIRQQSDHNHLFWAYLRRVDVIDSLVESQLSGLSCLLVGTKETSCSITPTERGNLLAIAEGECSRHGEC